MTANGAELPVLGLGTWQMRGNDCREAVRKALEIGYRHIDTAQMYRNEDQVGVAVNESGIDREDIFITTKLLSSNLAPKAVHNTLRRAGNVFVRTMWIFCSSTRPA